VNDELKQLREQLEQATSPHSSADETLDEETARLHEGWHALGSLLEEVDAAGERPLRLEKPWQQPRHRGRWLVVAALSASVVIAAGIGWRVWQSSMDDGAIPAEQQIATTDQKPATPLEKTQPTQKGPPPETEVAELAWDDSLDDRIASIGLQVSHVRVNGSSSTSTYESIGLELEQMERDISDGKL
jgi:hypothetical protein